MIQAEMGVPVTRNDWDTRIVCTTVSSSIGLVYFSPSWVREAEIIPRTFSMPCEAPQSDSTDADQSKACTYHPRIRASAVRAAPTAQDPTCIRSLQLADSDARYVVNSFIGVRIVETPTESEQFIRCQTDQTFRSQIWLAYFHRGCRDGMDSGESYRGC